MKRTIKSELLLAQSVPIALYSLLGVTISTLIILERISFGHRVGDGRLHLSPGTFLLIHTAFYLVLGICCLAISLLVSRPILRRITRNLKNLVFSMTDQTNGIIEFDYDVFKAVAKEGMAAQQEVKALSSLRDNMLSNCPWGFAIVDSWGRYIDINDQGLSMLGYAKQDFMEKRVGDISLGNNGALTEVLSTGLPSAKEIEVSVGGITKVILSHAFPITLTDGSKGAMTWFFDLTPWSEMQRLSAIGEMVSIIAHDVRNPLAAIKSKAQMACLIPDRVDNIKEWTRVSELVDEVTAYLTKLLSYSRGANSKGHSSVSAQELISAALAILQNKLAFTQVEIREEMDDPIPYLSVDPVEFQHVIMNLISNALDALDGKGLVRISCRNTDNGTITMIIEDNGKGIPKDILPNIWEMFYTTKPQGSGIGLAICRKSIERAGGTIHVHSTVGVGTKFTIELPAPLNLRGTEEQLGMA